MSGLIAGPYSPPDAQRGDWIEDAVQGRVEVGGLTSAPVPWPYRRKAGRASLILTGDLVRAVETESVAAICTNWGVGAVTVWSWRRALGIGRVTTGTRKLLQEVTGVPPHAAALGRERALAPESRAKISAIKLGKPAHDNTRAGLLRAATAPKPAGWGKRANAWMQAAKQRDGEA